MGARWPRPSFTAAELTERLQRLETHRVRAATRSASSSRMTERASRCYAVRFPVPSELTERILHPARPMESNGLEDARFVRFVDDDGTVMYLAPYTAYDGSTISQQLLSTTDFEAFDSFPLLGPSGVELGPARQLRFAHRARRGVARPHPRRRWRSGRTRSGSLRCRSSQQPLSRPGAHRLWLNWCRSGSMSTATCVPCTTIDRRCGSVGLAHRVDVIIAEGTVLTDDPSKPRPPPVLRLHHATGWRRAESIVATGTSGCVASRASTAGA